MDKKDSFKIAEHLNYVAPYHLGGFFNGWLEIIEIKDPDFKIFHIYSNERDRKLVTTYIRRI